MYIFTSLSELILILQCNPDHGLFVRRGFVFPLSNRRPSVHDVVLLRNKLVRCELSAISETSQGTVRYVGETVLQKGEMVGVELETAGTYYH